MAASQETRSFLSSELLKRFFLRDIGSEFLKQHFVFLLVQLMLILFNGEGFRTIWLANRRLLFSNIYHRQWSTRSKVLTCTSSARGKPCRRRRKTEGSSGVWGPLSLNLGVVFWCSVETIWTYLNCFNMTYSVQIHHTCTFFRSFQHHVCEKNSAADSQAIKKLTGRPNFRPKSLGFQ